jgi:hypothetical protein
MTISSTTYLSRRAGVVESTGDGLFNIVPARTGKIVNQFTAPTFRLQYKNVRPNNTGVKQKKGRRTSVEILIGATVGYCEVGAARYVSSERDVFEA